MATLRIALRTLLKSPAYALTIVATLALAIGVNSAIFSLVDAVLLKPLPYPGSERLVTVAESNPSAHQAESLVAPARLADWNRMSRSFEALGGHYFENITDTTGTVPERVAGERVSPRFFSVFGTAPALGRSFQADEEIAGGPSAVVISDSFWHKRFGGDPNVIGKQLRLGEQSHTVIGVMPPWFQYPSANVEMWLSAKLAPFMLQLREARFYTAVARLKEGVAMEQGLADLRTVQSQLAAEYPKTDRGWGVIMQPLKEEQVGGVRRSLWLLLGAVAFVLLIACGNIACLMLARGVRRKREIGVRLALGAGRTAVVRQLLAEGMLLSAAGSIVGLAAAYSIIPLLRVSAPQVPRLNEVQVDVRILGFTLALSVLTALVFSLAPAMQALRVDVTSTILHGARGSTDSRQTGQRLLVSAQVALALALLVGASLMLRSFERILDVSPGFDPRHVLTFRISAQWTEDRNKVAARHASTLEQLAAIPGVQATAIATWLPATTTTEPGEIRIPGTASTETQFAAGWQVSSGYFRTLGIPLLAGETCRDELDPKARSVVLVNRKFAQRFFADESPVGRQMEFRWSGTWLPRDIVGVVGDVREEGLSKEPQPMFYFCGVRGSWPDPRYLIRTAGDPMASLNAVRQLVRTLLPTRAVYDAKPLEEVVSGTLAQRKLNTVLLGSFAGMALLMAVLGLYGVMNYFVSQRTREIGLRMALGAQPGQVLISVLRQGSIITAGGLAAGMLMAAVLSRFAGGLLFGVTRFDPLSYSGAAAVLAIVAMIASLVPAQRAMRVDPMKALRDD